VPADEPCLARLEEDPVVVQVALVRDGPPRHTEGQESGGPEGWWSMLAHFCLCGRQAEEQSL